MILHKIVMSCRIWDLYAELSAESYAAEFGLEIFQHHIDIFCGSKEVSFVVWKEIHQHVLPHEEVVK